MRPSGRGWCYDGVGGDVGGLSGTLRDAIGFRAATDFEGAP